MTWRPYGSRSRIPRPCCRCGEEPPLGVKSGWFWRKTTAESTSASAFLTRARGRPGGTAAMTTEAICAECFEEEPTGQTELPLQAPKRRGTDRFYL